MEDVIEYNFITQPEWISDAIEFTETGIELNFKRLSSLCGQSKLPSRLCIILEGSQSMSIIPETQPNHTEKKDNSSNRYSKSDGESSL